MVAEAPPIPLKNASNCGAEVSLTFLADKIPITDPINRAENIQPKLDVLFCIKETNTASPILNVSIKFPCLALSIRVKNLSPKIIRIVEIK